ncbi:hypothetical protein FF3_00797 [Fretibacterium fastidiosum]|uniref:hypothetical protein n=1 Tax=Fretibacterium fastidiosum TaxID=651822 RepID=UPI0038FC721B
MRVSLLTNGPGELWGWVRPVAMELRRRGHSVSLWLLPCPFASGHEREAASLLGVDKLEGPSGGPGLWRAMADERTDCVIQLGGDMLFGARIARSARAPLLCYTYGPKKGLKGARVFTAFPSQARAIPGARAIGDLVKDALLLDATQSPERGCPTLPHGTAGRDWSRPRGGGRVLFLPGSRPPIRRAALPWLAAARAALRARLPEAEVRTLFPPFVPEAELREWDDAGLRPVRAPAGLVMRDADFALTQPGTNNFELMHCGVPSLVVAPESFLDLIPIAGLRGVLASLPLVGRGLRRAAARRILNRWNGVIALPNRLTDRRVMDELYGDVTPEQTASRMAEDLSDAEGLARAREELLALSGQGGAAARLCDAIPAEDGSA